MTAIQNAYNSLNEALVSATSKILGSIYGATSAMFFNGVAYTIIGIIVCVWLLQRLKDGLGDKDQWMKAGTWIIAVAFVFATLSSKPAFYEFMSWFAIPVSWLKNGVAAAAGGDFVNSIGNIQEIMDSLRDEMYVIEEMDKIKEKKDSWWAIALNFLTGGFVNFIIEATYYVLSFFKIEIQIKSYWFLYVFLFILIVAVAFMQLASLFMSAVVLSFAPLLVPCLAISPLKGFFFSWMKLYISIALYQPFSLLILAIAYKSVQLLTSVGAQNILDDAFAACMPSIVIAVMAFYCIVKIPQWVNQLMQTKVSGLGENFAGQLKGAAGVAGQAAAKYALKQMLKRGGQMMQLGGRALNGIGRGLFQGGKVIAQVGFKLAGVSAITVVGPIIMSAVGVAGIAMAGAGLAMRATGIIMRGVGKMLEKMGDSIKVTNDKK